MDVGERQAAVDIGLLPSAGSRSPGLASGVHRNVISTVESMTGLDVTEVNITVHDVFLDDGPGDESEPRVAVYSPSPRAEWESRSRTLLRQRRSSCEHQSG